MKENTNGLFTAPAKPLVIWVALGLMMLAGLGLAYFFLVKLVAGSLINPINNRDSAMAVSFIPISLVFLFLWFKTMAFLWKGASGARLALFVFAFFSAIPIIIASGIGDVITFNIILPLIIMILILVLFFLPHSHRWFKTTHEYLENRSQIDMMNAIKMRYPDIDAFGPSERAKMLRNFVKERKAQFKKDVAKPFWVSFFSSVGFAIVCTVIKVIIGSAK